MISQKVKHDKFVIIILVITGLLLWIYSIIKAYLIPINGDEIYTYEYYVKKGIIFLSSYNYIDANNHLLNTWLIEIVYKIFGDHDFVIRIPNLLAQLLFLIYSGKLALKLSTRILTIIAFLILNLNPYLNDYFMLARGYGISMGLMMISLYFAYKFIQEKDPVKSAFLSILFAAIALLANFTLLCYVIILATLLLIINFIRSRSKSTDNKGKGILSILNDSIIILIPLSVLFIVIPTCIKLNHAHAFYTGGYSNFWKYTVVSLIKKTFDNTPLVIRYTFLFEIVVIAILLASLLMIINKIRTDKSYWRNSFLAMIIILLISCGIENIAQHLLFRINYLFERTAIMYIPMFSLLLIFLLEISYPIFKKTTLTLCSVIFIVLMINFIHVASLNRVIQHVWSPDLRDMLNYLKENHKKIPEDKLNLSIGTNLEFEQDLNDYIATYFLTWLNRVDARDQFNPLNDYFFIRKKDLPFLQNIKYSVLKEFPKSQTVLLENHKLWRHKEIIDKGFDFWVTDGIELAYVVDDSLVRYEYSILSFKALVVSKHFDYGVSIITTVERGANVHYYNLKLFKDYMVKENELTQIYISVMLPKNLQLGDIIKTFIHRKMNYPIYSKDMEIKIIIYY
jgi:hypothetical protein